MNVADNQLLTLEELDGVFSVPTATYGRYQTGTVLPHFLRKVFLRRKNEPLPSLIIENPKGRDFS